MEVAQFTHKIRLSYYKINWLLTSPENLWLSVFTNLYKGNPWLTNDRTSRHKWFFFKFWNWIQHTLLGMTTIGLIVCSMDPQHICMSMTQIWPTWPELRRTISPSMIKLSWTPFTDVLVGLSQLLGPFRQARKNTSRFSEAAGKAREVAMCL